MNTYKTPLWKFDKLYSNCLRRDKFDDAYTHNLTVVIFN